MSNWVQRNVIENRRIFEDLASQLPLDLEGGGTGPPGSRTTFRKVPRGPLSASRVAPSNAPRIAIGMGTGPA